MKCPNYILPSQSPYNRITSIICISRTLGKKPKSCTIFIATHHDHSSEIRGLCLMKCSSETLQNLTYIWNTKTHVVFFISCYFIFSSNECLGLYRSIDIDKGIHQGENKVKRNEKRKKLHGFRWNISSSINILFLKSDLFCLYFL